MQQKTLAPDAQFFTRFFHQAQETIGKIKYSEKPLTQVAVNAVDANSTAGSPVPEPRGDAGKAEKAEQSCSAFSKPRKRGG